MENDVKHTVDKLLRQSQKKDEALEIAKEKKKEWSDMINRLFASPDGKFFGQQLVTLLGVFAAEPVTNPLQLVEGKTRRDVYLKLIRPYLDKTLRMEIEN